MMASPLETRSLQETTQISAKSSDERQLDTQVLLDRIAVLDGLLQDRDNMLRSIRDGDIDAVLLNTDAGDYQLYTLQNIDHPFQAFVQQMREGAMTLKTDGTIVYGNSSLAAMLGFPEEEIIGQQLQRFLVPTDVPLFGQMLNQTERRGTRNEFTVSSRYGNETSVYISLNFLRHSENATLLCGVVTDLSEQKSHLREMTETNANLVALAADLKRARDVAELANRAKTEFLTSVSHELRTPLNGILGYAQLLRLDEGLNASHLAKVDAMSDAGTHLLHMINGVLSLSEIEANHAGIREALTNVENIAGACLDLVRPTAAAKHLAVTLAMAPNVPSHIMVDPTRLRQVLLNLIGNAVKFTEKGSVELRLQMEKAGSCLRIEVADTGRGIPVDQQHRLFQEFERLSADVSGRIEGAGLGLSLSARLVAVMGGSIGYEDNPSGGSIFWLELPVSTKTAAPRVPDRAAVQAVDASLKPLRVLLVDDIAMNRDVADAFLRVAGHSVVCAEGGREALAAIASEDFDIILMDVRMPGMDGLEATRRIRALEGSRGRVPIVALTAQAFSGQVEECLKAGMDDHLGKPLSLGLLLETVRRVAAAGRTARAPECPPLSAPVGPKPSLEPVVLNYTTFKTTAAVLTQEAVTLYLSELVLRCEALLGGLRAPGGGAVEVLGEAAHALAGSAGMFGFEHLAATGRCFDHAIRKRSEELPVLAESFCAALETALEAMRRAPVVEVER
jgi:PAS domain S-box-containing protein